MLSSSISADVPNVTILNKLYHLYFCVIHKLKTPIIYSVPSYATMPMTDFDEVIKYMP